MTVTTPESRNAWLTLRRNYVSATDMVALEGLVDWASPMSVLHDKKGLSEEVKMTKPMLVGTLLEPIIRDWYERMIDNPVWLTKGEKVYKDDHFHACCTPDGWMKTGEEEALVEIKVSMRPWDGIPERVKCQTTFQAAVTGIHKVVILHLTVPEAEMDQILIEAAQGLPLTIKETPEVFTTYPEMKEQLRLLEKARDWWEDHIILGLPLPEQLPNKQELPKGKVQHQELVQAWREAKAFEKDYEAKAAEYKVMRTQVEAEISELLEEEQANCVTGEGYQISKAWVAGRLSIDHAGILNALLASHPEVAPTLKRIEKDFVSYGRGYARFTPKEV